MSRASTILENIGAPISETSDSKFKAWRAAEVKNGADIFYYKKVGNETEVWAVEKKRDKLFSTYNMKTDEIQRFDNLEESAQKLNPTKLDDNKFYAIDRKNYILSGPYNSESEAKTDLEKSGVKAINYFIDKGDLIEFILNNTVRESKELDESYVSRILVGHTTLSNFKLGDAEKYLGMGGECSFAKDDKVIIKIRSLNQAMEDKVKKEFENDNIVWKE